MLIQYPARASLSISSGLERLFEIVPGFVILSFDCLNFVCLGFVCLSFVCLGFVCLGFVWFGGRWFRFWQIQGATLTTGSQEEHHGHQEQLSLNSSFDSLHVQIECCQG